MDDKNTRDLQELEPFEEPVETDPTEAVEAGEPYFPATDPVVRTGRGGRVEIANGFDSAQVPEVRPAAAATDAVPSDGALEDAIRMELALDASTAYLDIRVSVRVKDQEVGVDPGTERTRTEMADDRSAPEVDATAVLAVEDISQVRSQIIAVI